MFGRVIACAMMVLAAGCARESNGTAGAASVAARAPTHATAAAQGAATGSRAGAATTAVTIRARAAGQAFAKLPDHGQLLAYPGNVVRRQGAYTWHRADLSEAYALRAIRDGHLQVTTPDGQALDFTYDRHIEHASGDWTWIGHRAGHALEQAVLTFGANAAFGSIAQPDKHPLRLTVRDGVSWLVETNTGRLTDIVDRMASKPDFLLAGKPAQSGVVSQGAAAVPSGVTAPSATVTGNPLVDVVLGYTPGFAAANGGNSGAVTRLNYLVDFANTAYVNSKLTGRVRVVAMIPVSYPDNDSNNDTLEKLSGFQAPSTVTTPDARFNALRTARETYGADLVSLVRKFQTPENESCGVAWLLGGGKSGLAVSDGWDYLGYSVVSDGTDYDEVEQGNYYCEDHTLAHELGHNMGLAHDRATSMGDDGVLDNPDDYGVYDYSFGYKKGTGSAGFYDVMAYGDAGQYSNNIFSNPRVATCGALANQVCGIAASQANSADASLSLSQTMPTIAAFRATKVSTVLAVDDDFNKDGKSDLLWRHAGTGADQIWLSADKATIKGVTQVTSLSWKMVGIGDFNGDGYADIFWRNTSTGANTIWKSASSASVQATTTIASQAWTVVGVGDFNADGKADILWRNISTGGNTIWKSGNSATVQATSAVTDQKWAIVGVGDFDGDHKSDILWHNNATGANKIWRSGSSATATTLTTITDLSWQVVGVGDFNGDGKDDILWRHAKTGANSIWKSGSYSTRQTMTTQANLAWRVEGTGDYNGDGKADVMWRNASSGADAIWLSANSATLRAVAGVTDVKWQIQP